MDLKVEAIFNNPNPTNVTFHDMKKFDLVNPVIGKLDTQVKASKLTDYEVTKKILMQGEIDALQQRLEKLKYGVKKDDDDDNTPGSGGEGGPGTPEPGPPKAPQQEMEEITRRLDNLHGNTQEVSSYNTLGQNSRIIAQKNNQKFVGQQINQRQREISKIPKGIVNKRKSSLKFNFPDTPARTPQDDNDYWRDVEQNWVATSAPISGPPSPSPAPAPTSLFDYDRDFTPLSKFVPQPPEPREASFLYLEGSLSPLRNRLPNIAPLPSRPSADNFSTAITKMTDESNNTISITPKKPVVEPIGQRQLFEQLQQFFSDVDQTIKKESETFKERSRDLDEIIEKLGKSSESDESFDEVIFEFEFFTGGRNSKFDSFVKRFGLTNENLEFVDFLQLDHCKKIMQSNDLKIHIETGNIYYNDTDTNESIFEFMKNQRNSSKGLINTDLKFDGTFKNYFQWILNEFEAQEKLDTIFLHFKIQNI